MSPAVAERDGEAPVIDPTVYWWGICGDEDDDPDPRDGDVKVDERPDDDRLAEFCAAEPGPDKTDEAPAKD